jgi:hypothetical protein
MFQVEDPLYFSDGYGIVPGDIIQLQGSSQRTQVVSVNRTTRTLNVNEPLAWVHGQGVALAYVHGAPNLGACDTP